MFYNLLFCSTTTLGYRWSSLPLEDPVLRVNEEYLSFIRSGKVVGATLLGSLSKNNDDANGSENVAKKLINFASYHVNLDPLNLSNVGNLFWS